MATHERKVIAELRELRLDLDLTYDEFAVRLGMSRRNVVRLLTAENAGMQDRTRRRLEKFVDANRVPQEAAAS